MQSRSLIFVYLLTLFYYCVAQNNTLPQCAQLCAGTAATAAGCSSYSNVTCVCTSQPFQSAIQSCFNGNCATTEQGTAWVYYSNLCTNGSLLVGSSSSKKSATVTSVSVSNTGSTRTPTSTSSGTSHLTQMTLSASTNVSSTMTSSQTSTGKSSSGALAVTDVQTLYMIMAVTVGGALVLCQNN